MSGLHIVSRRLKDGLRWHVYAWRGGPHIHTQDGQKPVIGPDLLDKAAQARQDRGRAAPHSLAWLVGAYRASPEFATLAASTRRDYQLWLDRIEGRFGTAPLAAFEDRRMRAVIMAWRDNWAVQPRSADKATVMLSTLLGWALQRGLLAINVAAGVPHLHRADRSEIIWTAEDWEAIAVHASRELMNALRLASLTGLRLGDLVALNWTDVGAKSIAVMTAKRKRRAVIPILPELAALMEGLGEREGTVLKNSRGGSWTENGLGTVYQRAKTKAGIAVRIHDLRGTYVTWLAMRGLTDEEIGRIVGWKPSKVGEVRHRYVDEAKVVVSLVDRLTRGA